MHDDPTLRRRTSIGRAITSGSAAVALAALSLSGLALPATAADMTWFVDHSSGTDTPECGQTSGAGACATIGQALTRATPDDVVAIAAGTYTEALTITAPVTLQGASAGSVTLVNPSADDAPTILVDADGEVTVADMTVIADSPGGSPEPIIHVAENRTATLSGVVINGAASAPGSTGVGVEAGGTLTIEDTSITTVGYGVMAGDPGAGAGFAPVTLSISSSTITSSLVGVAVLAGVATITGGSVSGALGAGLIGYSADAVFDVTGTAITDSGDAGGGTFRGGVVIYGGGTFLGEGVTISGNDNGLMLPDGGRVTLTNSTVTNNLGEDAGQGIFGRPGTSAGGDTVPFTVTLAGTEVSGHRVAMTLAGAETVQIDGSIIADNDTGIMAAAEAPGSTLAITNSAVVNNNNAEPTPGSGPYAGVGVVLNGPIEADIADTQIERNGAGIVTTYATVTVTEGSISDNDWVGIFAVADPGSELGSTVDLTGTAIIGNGLDVPVSGALGFGGIATSAAATVTGSNLTVTGNSIGAMMSGGTLSLSDSVVGDSVITSFDDTIGQPATGHGILAYGQGGSPAAGNLELVRTEVSGNERDGLLVAGGAGGTLLASTVAGNGGVGISRDFFGEPAGEDPLEPLLLAGSTVAENAAGAALLSEGTTLNVIGSILQAPDGVPVCDGPASEFLETGFNVVSDETCGFDSPTTVVGDPLLGALADNGGPTQTALPGLASPALNLLPTGTSVLWGDATIELCPGEFDQRGEGYPRLVGGACDAGAVEVSGGVVTVTASDATTYEGAFEPEITASYSGFLPGDTEADLDTLPTCSYDIDAGTTFCSGGADDFYDLEYVNGTLTVLDPLVIVTESLPDATVGDEYSVTLEATGGDGGPYTWGIFDGALPAGLAIDTETGEISGTPEVAGDVTFAVFVGDPITQEFTLSVAAAPTEPTTPPTTDDPTASDDPTTGAPGAIDDGVQGMPGTGVSGLGIAALALAIMVLGAALMLVARRRQLG